MKPCRIYKRRSLLPLRRSDREEDECEEEDERLMIIALSFGGDSGAPLWPV